MFRRTIALVATMWTILASPALAADVFNTVLYRIDVNSNPNDDGEVVDGGMVPGQAFTLSHPLGKGIAFGMADFGTLRASTMLDPDFPTDQRSVVSSQQSFEDRITIGGANLGAPATATLRLRVTGAIRQPFYVSEVTGLASASATLFASSDFDADNASASFGPQGPEPIQANYDQTLAITVAFNVGQALSISAGLEALSEAQDLVVPPSVSTFLADFANQAVLGPITLTGVVAPVVTSQSGHVYGVTTVSVPAPGALERPMLSQARPNPFRTETRVVLALPSEQRVTARILDVRGRRVRDLVDATLGAGEHALSWAGDDERRRAAPAGIYFLSVTTSEGVVTRKLLRVQ